MSGKVEQTRLITDFVGSGYCSTSGSNVVLEQLHSADKTFLIKWPDLYLYEREVSDSALREDSLILHLP